MSTTEGESDPARSGLVIALSATFAAVSTVVFGLRLYTRFFLLRTAGPDDWTIVVAQVMAVACSVATCLEGIYGLGRHIETLSEKDIRVIFICVYVTVFTYNIGLNIVKLSILLQYRRIFPSAILRGICRWGVAVFAAWTVAQQVVLSLACTPLALLAPGARVWCLDTLSIWVATSVVSLVTDFAIFMLPLPWIWDLQIPPRQKVVLFGVFGLGLVVCAISIIRVPTLRAAVRASDPTYDNVSAGLWTVAEINAAIVCSSLPTLRPLVFKMTSNLTGRTTILTRRKTMTRRTHTHNNNNNTQHSPEEFPPRHMGHQLEEIPSNYQETINRVSRKETNDSSDDLMSATYDEMMYGRRLPRQSMLSTGGVRRESFHTATASDGDISVELDRTSIPRHA